MDPVKPTTTSTRKAKRATATSKPLRPPIVSVIHEAAASAEAGGHGSGTLPRGPGLVTVTRDNNDKRGRMGMDKDTTGTGKEKHAPASDKSGSTGMAKWVIGGKTIQLGITVADYKKLLVKAGLIAPEPEPIVPSPLTQVILKPEPALEPKPKAAAAPPAKVTAFPSMAATLTTPKLTLPAAPTAATLKPTLPLANLKPAPEFGRASKPAPAPTTDIGRSYLDNRNRNDSVGSGFGLLGPSSAAVAAVVKTRGRVPDSDSDFSDGGASCVSFSIRKKPITSTSTKKPSLSAAKYKELLKQAKLL